jgi:acyl-CoA thioester hydrolase
MRLRVRNYEMDMLGHVNNAVYLHYLEQAAWEHSEYLGVDLARYNDIGGVFILRRMEIDYLRPAVGGDLLEVTTWADVMHGPRAVRKYEIVHASTGQLLVRATAVWAWVERATGRPRAIPSMLLDLFRRPADPAAGWQER